jgi:hypothetical protein
MIGHMAQVLDEYLQDHKEQLDISSSDITDINRYHKQASILLFGLCILEVFRMLASRSLKKVVVEVQQEYQRIEEAQKQREMAEKDVAVKKILKRPEADMAEFDDPWASSSSSSKYQQSDPSF